jgi:hypothetical protein
LYIWDLTALTLFLQKLKLYSRSRWDTRTWHLSSRPVWEAPTDVDPRLLDEERTMQAISEQAGQFDWNHNNHESCQNCMLTLCCRLLQIHTKKAMALGGGGHGQTSRLAEVGKTDIKGRWIHFSLAGCVVAVQIHWGREVETAGKIHCHAVYNSQWFWVVDVCWRPMYLNRKKCADSSMHWTQTMFWTGICHWYLPSHFGQSRAMSALSSSYFNSLHRLWSAG